MFPVFAIIFDEDVEQKIALQFPPLYRSLQKGRDLNGKTFMVWCWKSIFQGVVIMVLALVLFKNIFLEIETVAFTAMMFNQYALTLSSVVCVINLVALHSYSDDNIECGFSSILHPDTVPFSATVAGVFTRSAVFHLRFSDRDGKLAALLHGARAPEKVRPVRL